MISLSLVAIIVLFRSHGKAYFLLPPIPARIGVNLKVLLQSPPEMSSTHIRGSASAGSSRRQEGSMEREKKNRASGSSPEGEEEGDEETKEKVHKGGLRGWRKNRKRNLQRST